MHGTKEIFKEIEGYDCYMVSSKGELISNKRGRPTPMKPTENKSRTKPEEPGHLAINLRTTENTTRKEYVSRLVYETFGELPADYNRSEYVVVHRDSILSNNEISNLKLVRKSEFTSKRFAGTMRNKVTEEGDLPEDAVLFREGIYSVAGITRHSSRTVINGKDKGKKKIFEDSILWIEYNGKFHNVLITYQPGEIGEFRGTAFIRLGREDLPDYFTNFVNRGGRKKTRENNSWFSLPVAVILMEEKYRISRPSLKHRIGYRDFNFLNLTRENLVWELAEERNERVYEQIPYMRYRIGMIGKNNHTRNENRITDPEELKSAEEMYFLQGMQIRTIQKTLGKPDSYYTSIRYHLYKVKDGSKRSLSEAVHRQLTQSGRRTDGQPA